MKAPLSFGRERGGRCPLSPTLPPDGRPEIYGFRKRLGFHLIEKLIEVEGRRHERFHDDPTALCPHLDGLIDAQCRRGHGSGIRTAALLPHFLIRTLTFASIYRVRQTPAMD